MKKSVYPVKKILYSVDPLPSKAFIKVPDIPLEENEINLRRVNQAAIGCVKQIVKEFNEQKEHGISDLKEYYEFQKKQNATKVKAILVEVTEDEMNKIIDGELVIEVNEKTQEIERIG